MCSSRMGGLFIPDWLVLPLVEKLGISPHNARVLARLAVMGSVLFTLWKIMGRRRHNVTPPGPTPLPLLGNLIDLNHPKGLHHACDGLMHRYGDIVTTYFGQTPLVVLNTPELVREAFNRQGHATAERPYFYSFEIFSGGGMNITGCNNPTRLGIMRKLTHATFRKYASGDALPELLESVFTSLVEKIETDGHFNPYNGSFLTAYNILASMAFGKTFKFEDPFLQEMIGMTNKMDELLALTGFTEVFPILRYIPQKHYRMLKEIMSVFMSYIRTTYQEHLQSYEPDKLSDFTYTLINVMREAERDPDDSKAIKTLTEDHYIWLVSEIFGAGTNTSRLTLSWIWTYLAAFPDVQKKAQLEVDAVIGRSGHVTCRSRDQLPYVDAVLHEVMRIRPITPTGIMHAITDHIKLGGYDISKGSMLVQNTNSIHKDPRNWENPDAFLPERWLDENGRYIFQQKGFLPFSVGRRSCVGESFAKLEFHMLLTMMLQRYTLKALPGKQISLEEQGGFFLVPSKEQVLIARPRQ